MEFQVFDVRDSGVCLKQPVFLMLQLILGNSTHLEKSEEYRFFKPWLGDGLLISSGQLLVKHYSGAF